MTFFWWTGCTIFFVERLPDLCVKRLRDTCVKRFFSEKKKISGEKRFFVKQVFRVTSVTTVMIDFSGGCVIFFSGEVA